MKILAIDIGSSSVKAAVLRRSVRASAVATVGFATDYNGAYAQVDVRAIESAIIEAVGQLGPGVRDVDLIVPTTMAPSWLAIDARGHALTPVVTHQDRRATVEATEIEARVGRKRHLKLAGNRPFPGGISSTTWRWFNKHSRGPMKRAACCGHLSTYLSKRLCGTFVTDPSNAGFTGLYLTMSLGGWSDELIDAVGVSKGLLPVVKDANEVAGSITGAAADEFGLRAGTPVLVGCMDGSSAMLAVDPLPGRLLNVSGSTDVLALLVDQPRPHELLLTRPMGVGRRWLAVATLAAAGSAVSWVRNNFFSETDDKTFYALLKLAAKTDAGGVVFEPSLAGSRTAMVSPAGTIGGLTLGTTREQILSALCHALAEQGGNRVELLTEVYGRINPHVYLSGGLSGPIGEVLRKNWPTGNNWEYRPVKNATLKGALALAGMVKE